MERNEQNKAVVLLSGGLDSTTTLAIAANQGFSCYCLSFAYGQRHRFELALAAENAKRYHAVQHLVLNVDLDKIGGSVLTGGGQIPKDRASGREAEEIPPTYVPARNTIFLAYAVGWAEVVGARDIFLGVNAVDYSGYPDCRPAFLAAFQEAANLGTRAGVQGKGFAIHAPLLMLSKGEIIRKGLDLGVDYSRTHSCYDPDGENRACGRCDSCRLRLKGFAEAGVQDPAPYQEVA